MAGLTGEQAEERCSTAIFDMIAGELAAGRDVAIAGFGKFSVADAPPCACRNPVMGRDDRDRRQPRRCEVLRRGSVEEAERINA